jgi:hypothetical protein
VTDSVLSQSGLAGFVAGLAARDIETERRGSLIVYRLEPLVGGRAGQPVETGVAVDELGGWSVTPPHWIHVPKELNIAGASQDSAEVAWSRYSRPHPGRLDAAADPARAWVAHVREFLGHAA